VVDITARRYLPDHVRSGKVVNMYTHGIQIFIDGNWIFVPARDRNEAIFLRERSRGGKRCPSRRVLVKDGRTLVADSE
jgi:hypothetical protein